MRRKSFVSLTSKAPLNSSTERLTLLAASVSRMRRFLASFASPIRKYTRPNTAVVATVVTSTKASATRTADERKNSSIRIQHEARAAYIHDQRGRTLCVDLFPQIADVDIDDVGLEREMILPDLLQQHGPRDDPSGMAQEILQQAKFARQQIDPGAAAMDSLFDQIHFEIADVQFRGAYVIEAAQHRLYPRRKFDHRKWLCQVVVATGLQALDLFVNGGQGRDDQDGHLDTLLAQDLQRVEAVFAENDPVHDHHRGIAHPRRIGSLRDRGYPHEVALAFELTLDLFGHFRLVLDEHDGLRAVLSFVHQRLDPSTSRQGVSPAGGDGRGCGGSWARRLTAATTAGSGCRIDGMTSSGGQPPPSAL